MHREPSDEPSLIVPDLARAAFPQPSFSPIKCLCRKRLQTSTFSLSPLPMPNPHLPAKPNRSPQQHRTKNTRRQKYKHRPKVPRFLCTLHKICLKMARAKIAKKTEMDTKERETEKTDRETLRKTQIEPSREESKTAPCACNSSLFWDVGDDKCKIKLNNKFLNTGRRYVPSTHFPKKTDLAQVWLTLICVHESICGQQSRGMFLDKEDCSSHNAHINVSFFSGLEETNTARLFRIRDEKLTQELMANGLPRKRALTTKVACAPQHARLCRVTAATACVHVCLPAVFFFSTPLHPRGQIDPPGWVFPTPFPGFFSDPPGDFNAPQKGFLHLSWFFCPRKGFFSDFAKEFDADGFFSVPCFLCALNTKCGVIPMLASCRFGAAGGSSYSWTTHHEPPSVNLLLSKTPLRQTPFRRTALRPTAQNFALSSLSRLSSPLLALKCARLEFSGGRVKPRWPSIKTWPK